MIRRTHLNRWCAGLLLIGALLLAAATSACSTTPKGPPPAKLSVSGVGLLRNRELRLSLERLLGEERGEVLKANAVEDAMFLLMSAVQSEGYLKPKIAVECTTPDDRQVEVALDETMVATVPRDLTAKAVRFVVEPGVRYYMKEVTFEGLHLVKVPAARAYFLGDTALLSGKKSRAYTPGRLSRALGGLQGELRQLGYAESEVKAKDVKLDEQTGEVAIVVDVTEGVRWLVKEVRFEGGEATGVKTDEAVREFIGKPWTDVMPQSIAGSVRKAFFVKGYADVRVRVTHETSPENAGSKDVVVNARVRPGEVIKLGPIHFVGADHLNQAVLARRVKSLPDEPLNPLEIDQARFRLARLGVFEKVDVSYDPATGPVRSPVFTVREGRRLETNLLFGYGSYEQFRGGVELRQMNLFGRAHQSRLFLMQSMKSSRVDYSYTVPEIFGESVDGTARVFGLQRDELSFQRQEYGANASVTLPVKFLGATATAGYTFQALRNRDNVLATAALDDKQVTVASLEFGLISDRRDNPLRPRRGYRWFSQVEAASRGLGGEAEFQRIEFGSSYHTAWGTGRWIHLSATHGLITTFGTDDRHLPVNKRFFPGGDSSIRGYREGEASPRGPDGRFIGAKSYLLANVDVEQAISSQWSVVVFADAIATAAELSNYPVSGERLYSAGLGVRYHTLIGPIRVEYGRNLNPRRADPGGTWQISVGTPF